MENLTGKVLLGKYRLTRMIGRGGMGTVYEAEHTVITRRVAVKILHSRPMDGRDAVERFLREAQSASAIGHPNIVEIHDVGCTEDGTNFIIMELLAGESLSSFVRREGEVPPGRAVAISLQILSGLRAAHDKGIVHRDLKPDNIHLVRTRHGDDAVKILDFGISKAIGSQHGQAVLTHTGTVMGTPAYMSPEQARGEKSIDERTDIWAVGVILYEMLTGELPFQGDSYNEILSRILVEPVPSLGEAAPGLPPELLDVVERALAKAKEERYHNVTEFIRDLLNLGSIFEELGNHPELDALAASISASGRSFATDETVVDSSEVAAVGTPPQVRKTAEAGGTGALSRLSTFFPAPLLKKILWYLMTIPNAWGVLFAPPDYLALGAFSIFGLPKDSPPALAYLLAGLMALGLTVAAVLIERFWSKGRWNRWLQGGGFILFPIVGLLLSYRCHENLSGRISAALASFKAYAAVEATLATRSTDLLAEAMNQYLNTTTLVMMMLSGLSVMVLLGFLFAGFTGRRGRVRRSRTRWLVLLAGLAVIVLAETVVLRDLLSYMGWPWRFLSYLMWLLTAIPVLMDEPAGGRAYSLGWQSIKAGVVALLALHLLAAVAGQVGIFGLMAEIPPWLRPLEAQAAGETLESSLQALSFVTLSLLALLITANWRTLGLGRGGKPFQRFKAVGTAVATVLMMIVPFVVLTLSLMSIGQAGAIPWWKPAVVEMTPGTLVPGEPPSFYIDRKPSTLHRGKVELFTEMTGSNREEFTETGLVEQLSGGRECSGILRAALGNGDLGPDAAAAPARCVSAIEAKLYCEARGKRLPTPAEWEGALAGLSASESGGPGQGGLVRGDFGEWTMELKHGTATFKVMGLPSSSGLSADLRPDAFAPDIGFRCAYTFDD